MYWSNQVLNNHNVPHPCKDIILLLVGRSGSGKTTIANMLCENNGFTELKSYTTRPKRYEDEKCHIFATKEEFDKLKDLVAYTMFDNNEYCATKEQVEDADVYVIDPNGVTTFMQSYTGNKQILVMYLDASEKTCIEHMLHRGDDYDRVQQRALHDNDKFSEITCPIDIVIEEKRSISELYDAVVLAYEFAILNTIIVKQEGDLVWNRKLP